MFELSTASARREIHFIYQRSDAGGNMVGASRFARSYVSERGWNWEDVVSSVPRLAASKKKFSRWRCCRSATPLSISFSKMILSRRRNWRAGCGFPVEGVKPWRGVVEFAQRHQSAPGLHAFRLIGKQPLLALFRQARGSATAMEMYGLLSL